jgi:GDPmannose 4,6-dehydratase
VKALITGVTGQDGSYLSELLLSKGYEVHGLIRRLSSHPESLRWVPAQVKLHFGDLQNENALSYLIKELQPDEIYNLAAQTDVRVSFDIPEYTGEVTGLGVTRLLESIRFFSPSSKLYQASTSEMFGNAPPPQSEATVMQPANPYAAAKLYAHNMCQIYRSSYNLFICCGILFNHESPRRGKNFVTRKITSCLASNLPLTLGNTQAKRDWGYAPDYVEAMWLMMQHPHSDNYVVGTGETHSVGEFINEVATLLCRKIEVTRDPKMIRPSETSFLQADPSFIKKELGWEPKVRFKSLVKRMLDADLTLLE